MAEYKLLMPKMGESVIEATILTWHKQVGDVINEQDVILEVATDKVDTEVPSSVSGVLKQILHEKDAVVPVGDVLAIIEVGGDASSSTEKPIVEEKKEAIVETKVEVPESKLESKEEIKKVEKTVEQVVQEPIKEVEKTVEVAKQIVQPTQTIASHSNRYYSPLVLNIAQVEHISMQELENIAGNGVDNRVTKEDILAYVELKKKGLVAAQPVVQDIPKIEEVKQEIKVEKTSEKSQDTRLTTNNSNTEIIEMDRMRKLISQHMTNSVKTSAHVSSFVECDVTNIVRWRDKNKNAFQKREGFSLSFMPIFVEAITKAIKDFPMINVSVDGDKIIKKKDINIGIATALPSGNLIVPVVKQADQKSLLGIAKAMNTIVQKARTNTLQSDDVSEGTYTISNIGTFGNIIGTPIINQPQVAIMAVGSITKKPVVVEHDGQDVIAIRHMMYLSHTYDHRVVDGMLGGMFVKKVADYLEKFDLHQEI
ncbi:MAG: 2-oxo acid dehydrogenase subunit E2 [Chitinophagales bacterium]|nr:2-oxo acid dehydrogenase subunit E2 [Chitinophagales bacterium]